MSYAEQTAKLNQLIKSKTGAWDGVNDPVETAMIIDSEARRTAAQVLSRFTGKG